MRDRHAVHPLLLEPTYWRSRLQGLDLERPCSLITPRPDLSRPGTEVAEFRLKAHDGERLWGFFARPAWQRGPWPARIRVLAPAGGGFGKATGDVGPGGLAIDVDAVRRGYAEFVLEERVGRRLEDRVLDVVRVCHLAQRTEGADRLQVSFSCPGERRAPDEFLIAEQLFAGRFV
jgi:hypothetical protein